MPPGEMTLAVEWGNLPFHYMRESPHDFRSICLKPFNMMVKGKDVVFSSVMHQPNSVNSLERRRLGGGEKVILQGELTRRPSDKRAFLTVDGNKAQLTSLILHVWSNDKLAS